MVFGDVLYDGLVICSLHCSVEHSPVVWEPCNRTTVVFALMWSIYLLRCQLNIVLPIVDNATKLKRLHDKVGGVDCDDI